MLKSPLGAYTHSLINPHKLFFLAVTDILTRWGNSSSKKYITHHGKLCLCDFAAHFQSFSKKFKILFPTKVSLNYFYKTGSFSTRISFQTKFKENQKAQPSTPALSHQGTLATKLKPPTPPHPKR